MENSVTHQAKPKMELLPAISDLPLGKKQDVESMLEGEFAVSATCSQDVKGFERLKLLSRGWSQ
eukprot:3048427-Amphidinium_carterae.1